MRSREVVWLQTRRREFASALDGQLPSAEQKEALGKMLMDVLNEVRHSGDLAYSRALAYAFHNLPLSVHCTWFNWSVLLSTLEDFERQYPESGAGFLAQFDRIVGLS